MEFLFRVQEKVEVWYETKYEIEADSQEEANEKFVNMYKEGDHLDHIYDSEILYDTMEVISVLDNGNQSTEEIYNENDELIYDNATIIE